MTRHYEDAEVMSHGTGRMLVGRNLLNGPGAGPETYGIVQVCADYGRCTTVCTHSRILNIVFRLLR